MRKDGFNCMRNITQKYYISSVHGFVSCSVFEFNQSVSQIEIMTHSQIWSTIAVGSHFDATDDAGLETYWFYPGKSLEIRADLTMTELLDTTQFF